MAFTVIETQEQLDAIISERVARAKDSARKEFEGWISPDALEKKTAELNSQLTGLNDQIKTLTEEKTTLESSIEEKNGKLAQYEIDSVKTKVAREYGLSYDAIEFLQGADEEAIKKSAESLKHLVKNTSIAPQYNPESNRRSGDTTEEALRRMSKELKGE